jgi:threonine aldolase
MTMIDLRSDTVTKPTLAMKQAMQTAAVGDDVMGEDPTVIALQKKAAQLLGKEAAIFTPSGTMANQIAMGLHLRPGDQVMGHRDNHVQRWEAGAIARLWGASYKEVESSSQNTLGILDAKDFASHIQPDDQHYPVTRLISLENTLNRGGGCIFPLEKIKAIRELAHKHGLAMHLDGARLFNAVVATHISASEWAKPFETVSICLSKGLGCPVGSVLAGSQKMMTHEAKRLRKLLGGGMRQAGFLAAAGIHALDHHIERLHQDHQLAQNFAAEVQSSPCFTLEFPVATNMVWLRVREGIPYNAPYFASQLEKAGVRVFALTEQLLRAVFHLDISEKDAVRAAKIFQQLSPV